MQTNPPYVDSRMCRNNRPTWTSIGPFVDPTTKPTQTESNAVWRKKTKTLTLISAEVALRCVRVHYAFTIYPESVPSTRLPLQRYSHFISDLFTFRSFLLIFFLLFAWNDFILNQILSIGTERGVTDEWDGRPIDAYSYSQFWQMQAQEVSSGVQEELSRC